MLWLQNTLMENALFNMILSFLYSLRQVQFNTVFYVPFITATKYKIYIRKIKLLIS